MTRRLFAVTKHALAGDSVKVTSPDFVPSITTGTRPKSGSIIVYGMPNAVP